MKLDVNGFKAALEAKGLPLAEKAVVSAVDAILGELAKQAMAQPGDMISSIVAVGVPALQPAIDAELAKLLPDAAKA